MVCSHLFCGDHSSHQHLNPAEVQFQFPFSTMGKAMLTTHISLCQNISLTRQSVDSLRVISPASSAIAFFPLFYNRNDTCFVRGAQCRPVSKLKRKMLTESVSREGTVNNGPRYWATEKEEAVCIPLPLQGSAPLPLEWSLLGGSLGEFWELCTQVKKWAQAHSWEMDFIPVDLIKLFFLAEGGERKSQVITD